MQTESFAGWAFSTQMHVQFETGLLVVLPTTPMEPVLPVTALARHRLALRMARRVGSVLALSAFALYLISILPAPAEPVRIVTAIEIDRPAAAVFEFVTTPENWPKWHHSLLRVSGASSHGLQVGEPTTEDYSAASRYGQAQWTVTEREEPRLWRIEASGAEGGKAWITYTLSDTGHGTRFERDLRYRVSNLFTAVLDALVLRSRIKLDSETGLRQLKQVIEDDSHARAAVGTHTPH